MSIEEEIKVIEQYIKDNYKDKVKVLDTNNEQITVKTDDVELILKLKEKNQDTFCPDDRQISIRYKDGRGYSEPYRNMYIVDRILGFAISGENPHRLDQEYQNYLDSRTYTNS